MSNRSAPTGQDLQEQGPSDKMNAFILVAKTLWLWPGLCRKTRGNLTISGGMDTCLRPARRMRFHNASKEVTEQHSNARIGKLRCVATNAA